MEAEKGEQLFRTSNFSMQMPLLYLLNILLVNNKVNIKRRDGIQRGNIPRGKRSAVLVRFSHLHTKVLYCLISGCEQVDVGVCDLHELYAGKIDVICAFFLLPRRLQTLCFVGQPG